MTENETDRHDHVQAEIAKLMAETSQINQHMRWYVPVLFATGGAGFMTLAILIARFVIVEAPV